MTPRNKKQATGIEAAPYATAASGAMRESIGTKIKTNLVPHELTVAAALGLNHGAAKYEARNFEKGLSYTDHLESIKRHVLAMECMEDSDADSGLPHFALLASSVAMLCHNIMQSVIIEDRVVAKQGIEIGVISKLARQMELEAEAYRDDPAPR